MENNISILFYSKTSKKNKNNDVPIYLRITVNGKRIEQTTNRFIPLSQWSRVAGKMKGSSTEARTFNNFLDALKNKVHTLEREMVIDGKPITFETFRDNWFGVPGECHMILDVFQQHNDEVAILVGKDYSPTTLKRYKTSLEHTRKFIEWKYSKADIEVSKLNYEFISSYSLWLKSVRNCNQNSAMKYLGNFIKIVHVCLKNGWLSKDPFLGFKLSKHEVERPFLTEQELQLIMSRNYEASRLNYVKDIFIFSCYTGLAYADVQKLKRSEIAIGVDGGKWIFTKRQKTDTASRIPILPVAEALMDKYKDHPQCIVQDRLLPVFSNQKMNAYLKEIADTCNISKNLTFHIARHTFATTVTLSNGVPIETVSKMLGHKNIRTTQHYAKILDLKVSEDMMVLKKKLENKTSQIL